MALSIDELREKVAQMTEQGLNTQQIADELSISQRTVMWLNSGASETEQPADVRIGWRTIGARPNRINAIGAIMADAGLPRPCNPIQGGFAVSRIFSVICSSSGDRFSFVFARHV